MLKANVLVPILLSPLQQITLWIALVTALDTGITWSPGEQPALPISIWPFRGPCLLPVASFLVTRPCSLHPWPFVPNKTISRTGLGAIPLEYDLILKNVIAIFFPNFPRGTQTSELLLERTHGSQQACRARVGKSPSEALTQHLKEPRQRHLTGSHSKSAREWPSMVLTQTHVRWHQRPHICCWDPGTDSDAVCC